MGTFNAAEVHVTGLITNTNTTVGAPSRALWVVPAAGYVTAVRSVISAPPTVNDIVLTISINGTTTGVTLTHPFAGGSTPDLQMVALRKYVAENDIVKVAVTTSDAGARAAAITLTLERT